ESDVAIHRCRAVPTAQDEWHRSRQGDVRVAYGEDSTRGDVDGIARRDPGVAVVAAPWFAAATGTGALASSRRVFAAILAVASVSGAVASAPAPASSASVATSASN